MRRNYYDCNCNAGPSVDLAFLAYNVLEHLYDMLALLGGLVGPPALLFFNQAGNSKIEEQKKRGTSDGPRTDYDTISSTPDFFARSCSPRFLKSCDSFPEDSPIIETSRHVASQGRCRDASIIGNLFNL